jgi:hypothetical protein
MARRKNASFTGSPLYSGGTLVDAFYKSIKKEIPGKTPVPIPPPASVHPKHDAQTQAFIFADYAVRKLVPISLEAAGLKTEASKLRKSPKIVDKATAHAADAAVYRAGAYADDAAAAVGGGMGVGAYAADKSKYATDRAGDYAHAAGLTGYIAARYAAALNPEATWEAVNEMLAEL